MQIGIIKKIIEMGRRKRLGREYPPGTKICAACNGPINPEDKRTRQLGYHFHRSCWRKQQNST